MSTLTADDLTALADALVEKDDKAFLAKIEEVIERKSAPLQKRVDELLDDNTRLHNDNVARRSEAEEARRTQRILEKEVREQAFSQGVVDGVLRNDIGDLEQIQNVCTDDVTTSRLRAVAQTLLNCVLPD